MATINKRPSGKWQATVRSGGKSASKTFTKRAEAAKWAREIELQAEAGGLLNQTKLARKYTVADVLRKFRDEVVPQHRSADREARCIDALLRHHGSLCRTRMDALTSADVCKWRDKRLTEVSPGTVVRELTLLQSAVGHALEPEALNLVLPPLAEQREIAAHLQQHQDTHLAIAQNTKTSVARLREFRSALITAAVTGQIDVTTWGKQGSTDRRLDQIEEEMSA